MEGLSVSNADLVVYVHPSQSKNVRLAILRQLSTLLFKYNETFQSVVLGYEFDIPDKRAKILSGIHPYFGVRLKAKLLTFSPRPDILLEGKIVKLSRESIHAIVLGFSSAIITKEDIRGEFRYKHKHGKDLYVSRSHKRHVMKEGTVIRFAVKSWDEEILHFFGSLTPAHTGNVSWLDKYLIDATLDSNTKKRNEKEIELQQHVSAGGEASVLINDSENKKSKKQKLQ